MATVDDKKVIFSMVGVSKTIQQNQKQVLKNIYLSFFYGAKIGIIGLNGAGKSTLMKIIAGIDLMIGADLHTQMYCEPGTMQNDFPIFVNNEARRLDVLYSNGYLTLRSYRHDGKVEFEKTLKP